MVDGKIEALTPKKPESSVWCKSMDEVFFLLARTAQRKTE